MKISINKYIDKHEKEKIVQVTTKVVKEIFNKTY